MRVQYDWLRPEEAQRVLDAAKENLRDHTILACFLFAGLRCNELRMLNTNDVDLERGTLMVLHAKGGKQRLQPLAPELLDQLAKYLEVRRSMPYADALFVSREGNRLSNRQLRAMVKQYGKAANIRHIPQGLHPHALRHSFATLMLREQVDLRTIQELMGHSSLSVTQAYLAVDLDAKRSAVSKLPLRIS